MRLLFDTSMWLSGCETRKMVWSEDKSCKENSGEGSLCSGRSISVTFISDVEAVRRIYDQKRKPEKIGLWGSVMHFALGGWVLMARNWCDQTALMVFI